MSQPPFAAWIGQGLLVGNNSLFRVENHHFSMIRRLVMTTSDKTYCIVDPINWTDS